MTNWTALDRFLTTDPRDIGCEEAMAVLEEYVDLVVSDPETAKHYVGVVAHLDACGPCAEDFHGLLAAVTGISE